MREIKFRAWDKVNNIMCKVLNIAPSDDGICSVQGIAVTELGVSIRAGKYFELMQDTGLKDKNGVEIYEGDILSYPEEEQIISIVWDDSSAGWEFNEHSGLDDGVGRGDWDFNIGIAKNCKVIGNIYENPELLDNE
jgi:uncharacterized phage protein (TIGR01671 family)